MLLKKCEQIVWFIEIDEWQRGFDFHLAQFYAPILLRKPAYYYAPFSLLQVWDSKIGAINCTPEIDILAKQKL